MQRLFAIVLGVLVASCSIGGHEPRKGTVTVDLRVLLRELPPAERAILDLAVSNQKRTILTIHGTPGEVVWSALTQKGLMKQLKTPDRFRKGGSARVYSVTDKGREFIPKLLREADGG